MLGFSRPSVLGGGRKGNTRQASDNSTVVSFSFGNIHTLHLDGPGIGGSSAAEQIGGDVNTASKILPAAETVSDDIIFGNKSEEVVSVIALVLAEI